MHSANIQCVPTGTFSQLALLPGDSSTSAHAPVIHSFLLLRSVALLRGDTVGLTLHSLNMLVTSPTDPCKTSWRFWTACLFSDKHGLFDKVLLLYVNSAPRHTDSRFHSVSWNAKKIQNVFRWSTYAAFALTSGITTKFLSILNTNCISISLCFETCLKSFLGLFVLFKEKSGQYL